jgi:hypothetical protein
VTVVTTHALRTSRSKTCPLIPPVDFRWTRDCETRCAACTSWPFTGYGSIYLSRVSQLSGPHPTVAFLQPRRDAESVSAFPVENGIPQLWRAPTGAFFCNEFCADDAEEAMFQRRRKCNYSPRMRWSRACNHVRSFCQGVADSGESAPSVAAAGFNN